ncbi:MAG: VOC family protein [Bacteroidales bacterium]|nr:VOC family protein [Bacteroidales bacterium]
MIFHSSVIFVTDIEKSKDFYIRVIGQTVEHDFGNNLIFKGGLSIWQIGAEHIVNQHLKTKGESNRFELYFETKRIEEIAELLKSEGVRFLHNIKEEPWGQRTIRFFDPDNHLIEVGEPLEEFVNNMYQNGLTIDQIAKKSGIPVETVMALVGLD